MHACRRPALALATLMAIAPASCAGGGDPPAEPAATGPVAADAGSAASRARIRGVLESYYTAFSARDWPRFEAHFWPGATMTTVWAAPGETPRVLTMSVPDFVREAPSGPGSREIFEERMTSVRVTVTGGLAQAWATYEARFGDPGDVHEWTGVDAFTLLRHEGEWRITSLAYAVDGG